MMGVMNRVIVMKMVVSMRLRIVQTCSNDSKSRALACVVSFPFASFLGLRVNQRFFFLAFALTCLRFTFVPRVALLVPRVFLLVLRVFLLVPRVALLVSRVALALRRLVMLGVSFFSSVMGSDGDSDGNCDDDGGKLWPW